jgi:hypothetical protein
MSGFGDTWTPVTDLYVGGGGIGSIWASVACSYDGKYVLLGNATATITVSSNYGLTWQTKDLGIVVGRSSAMDLSGQYQLTARYGNICRSTNYGVSWSNNMIGIQLDQNYSGLCISSTGQYQYACSSDAGLTPGIIIKSSTFGDTWASINSTIGNRNFTSIATDNTGQYVTVVASMFSGVGVSINGGLWTSDDGGITWTDKGFNNTLILSVAMSGDGQYQTVVTQDSIYRSDNYGNTWSLVNTSIINISSVRMDSTGKYQTLVVAGNGYIYVSTNYGSTWIQKAVQQTWRSNAVSGNGVHQYATYNDFFFNTGVYRSTATPVNIELIINGSGTVTVGSEDYSGPGTYTVPVLPGAPIEAVNTDTAIFIRWSGANSSRSPVITVSEDGTLTANFAEAPVVTRRKYWPSQTELTDDSKSCQCGCFKPAQNYGSASERAHAIRFAASGCGCCRT